MVARKAVPADLADVETKRLARQLTALNEAIFDALESFATTPTDRLTQDAVRHVRGWAREAARDARRLHAVLA